MDKTPKQLKLSPATRAAQALRHIDSVTGAVTPAIELSSTFARDENYAPRQSYVYARDGGPTVKQAEDVLTSLEGGEGSLVFASGMAAVVTLFETLNTGDHVVAQQVMYHGVIDWLHRLQDKRGIKVSFFDQSDENALENAITPDTKLVWIETPSNPSWDVVDIEAAAIAAHAAGALLAVDCTVAPPCTSLALELGADYVFHSATKYLGGHSDITAGVLTCTKANEHWASVCKLRTQLGNVIRPFDAWLLIRGMRTLYLRYERASESAMKIAQHFENHPKIASVLYPGLPTHPGHSIAARQMTGGFGGMMSLLTHDAKSAHDVARFVQVFIPATSLGGVKRHENMFQMFLRDAGAFIIDRDQNHLGRSGPGNAHVVLGIDAAFYGDFTVLR